MLKPNGEWFTSDELARKEFNGRVPLNGRMCVTVALRQAAIKLKKNREEKVAIEKRGGGRGGNWYRLKKK